MKKVITLLMVVLMIFSLAACNNNDSKEPSQTGESFYDLPDFSTPPTATGDTAKVTLQEMVSWVNNTKPFSFEFATMLEKSTQTLYTSTEFKDGKEVKDVAPLGLVTFVLESFDFSDFGDFESSDFELYDSDKMAKVKEAKLPKSYMECVVTDVCLDLTDASLIIRAAYVIDEKDESSTYFCTARLTYLGDNQYKLVMRGEDYGDAQGKEYVYITTEEFVFNANDYKVVEGTYNCKQETSLVYETMIDVAGSKEQTAALIQRSEVITVDIDIKCKDGIYTVDREMIMKQSDESYDPAKATEIYRVHQHIEQKDGIYVLTEHAKGTDNNGKPVDLTQYVTFTEKTS